MRWCALLLTLIGVCLVIALNACGGDFAGDGKAAFEEGKYHEAVDLLQIAIAESDDPEVRFYLGVGLFRMGRPRHARDTLAPLLDNERFGKRALRQTVDILIDLGESDQAGDLLRDALAKEPSDPNLLEASVAVNAARVEGLRGKIMDLFEAHFGKGRTGRVKRFVNAMVTAKESEFVTVFDDSFEEIKTTFGFTDERSLKDLVVKSRAALSDLQATLRRTADVDASSFQSRLELAAIAGQRKDFDTVLSTCTEILEIQPESIAEPERRTELEDAQIESLDLIGNAAENAERYGRGIEVLERNIETFGQSALNVHLARLYYLADERDKLADLSKAWIIDEPRNYWACFYRGWTLYSEEAYEEAIPYLVRAHGTRPNTAAFNLILGRAYEKQNELGQALMYLRAAQELDPREPEPYLDVARVYSKIGEEDEARKLLSKALTSRFRNRDSEEHALILGTLVNMYKKVGAGIRTIAEARRLLESDADNPYLELRLAQLLADRGQVSDALKVLRRVQVRLPNLADAWRVGARIALDHRQWGQVHWQLRKLEQIEPKDPVIPWLRASAYLAQRRLKDAYKEARAAVDENPTAAGVRCVLIDVELAERKWERAMTTAQSALKVLPGNEEIRLRLAKAYLGGQEWAKAAEELLTLESTRGDDPDYLNDLSRALTKSGNPDAALKRLEHAHTIVDETDYSRRLHLATLFYDAKAFERAAELFAELDASLPRKSPLRRTALQKLARSRHASRDYLGACDALVALRRRDHREIAYNLFMEIGSFAGAHHEVASVFDLAAAEARVTQRGLKSALASQLVVGAWRGAEEAIRLLGQLDPDARSQLLLDRARVQLGRGQKSRGLETLRRAVNAGAGTDTVAVYVTWLKFLVADEDPKTALGILDEAIAAAPSNGTIRRLGGEAALMLGETERAGLLFEEAVQRSPRDDRARLLLCISNAARRSYPAALDALPQPRDRTAHRVRSLVEAVAANRCPPGPPSLAQFLWHLRNKDFEKASAAAMRMGDVPRVWRPAMARLADHLRAHPERAPLTAELYARAAAFSSVGVLAKETRNELAEARTAHVDDAYWTELYTAGTLIRYGAAKSALPLLTPRLKAGIHDPLVIYLTGVATMKNTDAGNLTIVLDGHLGKGPIEASLARDLRDAALAMDADEVALTLTERIANPSEEDLATKARILSRLGRHVSAGEAAAGIGGKLLEADPMLQFIAGYGRLLSKKPDAKAFLEPLLADATATSLLDPVLLVDALVRAKMTDRLPEILERSLKAQPYDAYTFHQLAQAVGSSDANRPLYERLLAAASLVDPRAALRSVRRDDRPRAGW